MRIIALSLFLLFASLPVPAQRVGLAYWNVDRLYDTVASPFHRDDDFTPSGRMCWTSERYSRKISAVAAVIDSMSMPVTMLYGVENESVVRDIAAACRGGYSYIHRTLNSLNGMDFALLYYGDLFIPDLIRTDRRSLCVGGTMLGRRVVFLMCRDAGDACRTVAEIRRSEPGTALIVAGRPDLASAESFGLADAFAADERAGRGCRVCDGLWCMDEHICIDSSLRFSAAIYARRHLFSAAGQAPEPTFDGRRYAGGASRWLPLTVSLCWP